MPVIAEVERTIAGPIDAVFSQFIDFRRWSEWMPKIFRPLRGPSRPLRTGDRLVVLLGVLPSLITVERVDAPHSVTWSGGVPGVLVGRHSFTFEAVGERATRILSVEPWTGIVPDLKAVGGRLKRAAEDGGRGQLKHFERWFSANFAH